MPTTRWARTRAEIRYRLTGRPEQTLRWVVRAGGLMPVWSDAELPDQLDDATLALIWALSELDDEQRRAFNPELHKRWPRGHPQAGKFRPMVDLLKMAIAEHKAGEGKHPFENFTREQLRNAAKARGIKVDRGEDRDSIAAKLLADLAPGNKQGAKGSDLVAEAKKRQADIDYARARAELISEAEEWLNNQGRLDVMAVQLRRDANRLGIKGHKDVAALFAAIDAKDKAKIRDAIEAIAKEQKLSRIERAGDVVRFDRAMHADIGKDLKAGDYAIVARPGYHFDRDGEVIRLHKAKVEKATPAEIAAAKQKAKKPVGGGRPLAPEDVKHLNERDLKDLAAELGVKQPYPALPLLRDIVAIKLRRELAKAQKAAPKAAAAAPPIPEMGKLDRMPEAKLRALARKHGIPEAGVDRWDLALDLRKKARAEQAKAARNAPKPKVKELENMPMWELSKLAHQHGITVGFKNAGELRQELKDKLFPAKPGDPRKFHTSTKGLEDLQKAVEQGTVIKETRFAEGAIGDTRKRQYDDGTTLVWKRTKNKGEQDAEQLAALVARALGLQAPRIYRNRPDEINMEFIEGDVAFNDPAIQNQPGGWGAAVENIPDQFAATKEGRMMGLLDQLIANTDRHNANWMLGPSGHIHPIDHGYAFGNRPGSKLGSGAEASFVRSGFGTHYAEKTKRGRGWQSVGAEYGWKPNELTPSDVAKIRRRLESLRADFEKLGRGDWHKFMLERLDAIGQHAKGKRSQLLPSLVQ